MFGKRKGPGRPGEPSAPQLPEAAGPATTGTGIAAAAGGASQKAAASGTTPAPKPALRRPEGRPASAVEGRKLVVGREICLSGEIKTCEKLVVEGRVEADLRDSHSLEIAEPGVFKGSATVEDCEISGTFEGELTVTGVLVVLPTGRVSGRIRYAEMELSRGARLSGDIDMLDEAGLRRARGEGPTLAHDSSAPTDPARTDTARTDPARATTGAGKSQIG
jgi:cytoskeletal protein CcmA (bactofilin family)